MEDFGTEMVRNKQTVTQAGRGGWNIAKATEDLFIFDVHPGNPKAGGKINSGASSVS